jgi:hypothetical protein
LLFSQATLPITVEGSSKITLQLFHQSLFSQATHPISTQIQLSIIPQLFNQQFAG